MKNFSITRKKTPNKAFLYSDCNGTFIGEFEYDACCEVGADFYDPILFEKIGTGHISEINSVPQTYTRNTIHSYDFYRLTI